MAVKRMKEVAGFLEAAGDFLVGEEARNNLALRIAATLRDQPEVYPEHELWHVEVNHIHTELGYGPVYASIDYPFEGSPAGSTR
jgi:hypothetical protein